MQWDGHMRQLFKLREEDSPSDLESFLALLDTASQEAVVEAFDAARNRNSAINVSIVTENKGRALQFIGRFYLIPGREGQALSGVCMEAPQASQFETRGKAESDQELANFASVASHDLREPLRMISSYLQLLEERSPESLDDRARRYIKSACDGVDRMRGLIEDLLSYSRIDSEAEAPGPIALAEVLTETINILSPTIHETGAEVTLDFKISPIVSGDRTNLGRLFQNLISNAIKFHAPGQTPRVRIELQDGDDSNEFGFWIVAVKDSGIGIDHEHRELIFRIFQRLHTREEYEGSGIGLAICRKIIGHLGGRIDFDSEKGKGSTFYVHLKKENT